MTWHKLSRKYHKWLMLFLGLQFLIWAISGLYMVVFDIHYIHGDSLVTKNQVFLQKAQVNYPLAKLYAEHPKASNVALTTLLGAAVYRYKEGNKNYLVSADSGKMLSPINETDARRIAKSNFHDTKANIRNVFLIEDEPPSELSSRHLPVWRVDFEDSTNASFYISVQTGKLVTKRHTYWRIFDWMFSFHVMDYVEEDASNKLLFVTLLFALLASFFGFVLTYFRVIAPRANKKQGSAV